MGLFGGQSEIPSSNERGGTTVLEQLVRQNQELRRLFVDGISHHLELLKLHTQDAFGQEIDTSSAEKQFNSIIEAFNTGFNGYVVRISTTDRAGFPHLSFAKREDLYAKNPTKLNTAPGRKPQEIIVSLSKYSLFSNESNDPGRVLSGKGIQIAAFTQQTHFDPLSSQICFERGSGFSIRMPETGGCMGIGTKWNGLLEYQSDLTTDLSNLSHQTIKQYLENSIKQPRSVAFNPNFR